MYNIIVTANAHSDLEEIVTYIHDSLSNPTAAMALLDDVSVCYAHLERNPKIYEHCAHAHLYQKGYRRVVINNYIMVYRIDEAKKNVYVLRFFYGKRDYQHILL